MSKLRSEMSAINRVASISLLINSLSTSLNGLPATLSSSGKIIISDNATPAQFAMIADAVGKCSSASTTLFNFAKGDLWNEACERYGGGRQLMVQLYGEENADVQSIAWKNLAVTSRKVPPQDRDVSRPWNFYRNRYNEDQGRPIISGIDQSTVNNGDSLVVSFQKGPVAKTQYRPYQGSEYAHEVHLRCGSVVSAPVDIVQLALWAQEQVYAINKKAEAKQADKDNLLLPFHIDAETGEILDTDIP